MNPPPERRVATLGGWLYLATFATSFPGLAARSAYLDQGGRSTLTAAVVLEVLLAASCVGTALALIPVTRRVNETLALGFVASRTIEAAMIMVGVLALLSLAQVREDPGTAAVQSGLEALHDATFLLGPAVMSSINALLLGTLLLRSRLVPRAIPLLGLVGAPLLLLSCVAVVAGSWGQTSLPGALAAVPIALWELSLGLWLVTRGWRS